MTAFFNLGSLVLGLGAWVLACFAVKSKAAFAAYRLSVCSLSLCAVSLFLQILEVNNRTNLGDFSAIADTIQSVVLASCVLIIITAVLNIIAAIKAGTGR